LVFWHLVPGLDAIRAPFRVQLLLYSLAAYVVLRTIELWVDRRRHQDTMTTHRRPVGVLGAILTVVLALSLLIEMDHPFSWGWKRHDLLNPSLHAHMQEVEDRCDSFILTQDAPGAPLWLKSIDAVILSMLTGVPTPQGYSRDAPI